MPFADAFVCFEGRLLPRINRHGNQSQRTIEIIGLFDNKRDADEAAIRRLLFFWPEQRAYPYVEAWDSVQQVRMTTWSYRIWRAMAESTLALNLKNNGGRVLWRSMEHIVVVKEEQ